MYEAEWVSGAWTASSSGDVYSCAWNGKRAHVGQNTNRLANQHRQILEPKHGSVRGFRVTIRVKESTSEGLFVLLVLFCIRACSRFGHVLVMLWAQQKIWALITKIDLFLARITFFAYTRPHILSSIFVPERIYFETANTKSWEFSKFKARTQRRVVIWKCSCLKYTVTCSARCKAARKQALLWATCDTVYFHHNRRRRYPD